MTKQFAPGPAKPVARRPRSTSTSLVRAAAELLESRRLLAVPLLQEPLPREQRDDYIFYDSASGWDLGPVSRFEWEYSGQRLAYRFDQPVDVQRGHLVVTRLNNGVEIPAGNVVETKSGLHDSETFTFANGTTVENTLDTGNYEALMRGGANGPANEAGERLADQNVTEFYVMHGDASRDRVINGDDYGTLDNSIQFPGAAGYFNGDANYDGVVDGADYGLLDNEIQMYNGVDLPPPPRGANELNAYACMGRGRIDVDWSPPADMTNVDGFRIYRSTDSVNYTLHATVADPNATNWYEDGLLDGQKFYYRVRAYSNVYGNAVTTNEDYAVTGLPQPTGLTVSAVTPSAATLHWTDNSNGEDGFEILRHGADGTYAVVATVAGHAGEGAMSLPVTDLTPDTQYSYRVRAFTGPAATKTQASFDSAPVDFATPVPGKLAAPVNVTATPLNRFAVEVTWDDASDGEIGFIIARHDTGGEWVTIATVDAGVTSYTDTSTADGTAYAYAIYAKGATGGSTGTGSSSSSGAATSGPSAAAKSKTLAEGGYGVYQYGPVTGGEITAPGVSASWSPEVTEELTDPEGQPYTRPKGLLANTKYTLTLSGLPKHSLVSPSFGVDAVVADSDISFTVNGKEYGSTHPTVSITMAAVGWIEHTGSSLTLSVEITGDYEGEGPTLWASSVNVAQQEVWISGATGLGEPSHDGSFTVHRAMATDTALPVKVMYNGYGSANQNDYYLPPNTVTIPADESSVTVPLRVRDDSVVEDEESFFIELQKSDKYRVADDAWWAEIGIGDDDSSGGGGTGGTGIGGGGGSGADGGGPPIIYDPPIEPPPPPNDDEPPPDDDPTTVNNSVHISGGEGGSTKDGDGEMAVEEAQWVRLNDDFDKDANADDGSPQRDSENAAWVDDRPDDELFGIGASFTTDDPDADEDATIAFEFGGNVRLWRPADDPNVGADYVEVSSGDEFNVGRTEESPGVWWSGGFHVVVDPIAESAAPGDVQITAVFTHNGDTVRDTIRLTIVGFDLDVDSDNTNGFGDPDYSASEDYIEETESDQKMIAVNDGDSDGDGIAGMVDGWDRDEQSADATTSADNVSAQDKFVPVVFDLPGAIDPSVATMYIFYPHHDPLDPPTPPPGGFPTGHIRLWKKPGDAQRNANFAGPDGGDYVVPGASYFISDLGASETITLHAEAIVHSREKGDVKIVAYVDPDGDGPRFGFMLMDSVQLTAVDVGLWLPDAGVTTTERPFRFWLNNDHDLETEDGSGAADSGDTKVAEKRDLEDFSRVQFSVSNLVDVNSGGTPWYVKLAMTGTDGSPSINAFSAADPGNSYLTDDAATTKQWRRSNPTWLSDYVAPLSVDGSEVNVSATYFNQEYLEHHGGNFIFEGKTPGKGKLVARLYYNDQLVGESQADVQLNDVKDLYDRYSIAAPGANIGADGTWSSNVMPTAANFPTTPTAALGSQADAFAEKDDYFLFVHGWRMRHDERLQFAETALKRMYWSGYRGRFGMYEWPTQYTADPPSDPGNYDRSEMVAWHSGKGLKNTATRIRDAMPANARLSIFAHSMGAVVTSEALKMLPSSSGVNNTIFTQGAASAHYYDNGVPASIYASNSEGESKIESTVILDRSPGGDVSFFYNGLQPSDGIGGVTRFGGLASRTRLVNFYNSDDYALMAWRVNQAMKPSKQALVTNLWLALAEMPPLGVGDALEGLYDVLRLTPYRGFGGTGYSMGTYTMPEDPALIRYNLRRHHDGASDYTILASDDPLVDPYELFAFGASSVAPAVGHVDMGTGGPFAANVNIDLLSAVFDGTQPGHSAQFYGASSAVHRYWAQLVAEGGR